MFGLIILTDNKLFILSYGSVTKGKRNAFALCLVLKHIAQSIFVFNPLNRQ